MLKIVIIGTGNISYHLCKAIIETKNLKLIEVFGRKKNPPKDLFNNISYCNNIKKIQKADLYILCVSDNAISKISDELNINKNSIVVHTSGSTNMKLLSKHKNHGIIYPLQTFSKNKKIPFTNIPIIIEANSKLILNKIRIICSLISNKVIECNNDQRTLIHISAVFANNFSNYMNLIAEEILKSNNINSDILYPLINETANKLNYLSPKNAQTGPAIRNDQITIQKHLNLLKKTKYFEIYDNLTKEIIKSKNEL